MKLPKPILAKVAIASGVTVLSGLGLTGVAIHQGEQALWHPLEANGAYQEPNAFEEFGIWLGLKCDLIRRPTCGMCGTG